MAFVFFETETDASILGVSSKSSTDDVPKKSNDYIFYKF